LLFIESADFTRDVGNYMTDAEERGSLFERLSTSLREADAFVRGEVELRSLRVPGPPPRYGPAEIACLRHSYRMSLESLAQLLGVSPNTVRGWEEGAREPGPPARRLLQLLEQQPEAFARIA